MANRFSNRSDYSIPTELIDEHEWMSDYFIDGDTGVDCTLIYPPSDSECPNCLYDPGMGRSANIYKIGGPYSFTNHTICPYCGGVGKFSTPVTYDIRLRVYWGSSEINAAMKQFALMGEQKFVSRPAGLLFVIGYMDDLNKFVNADAVLINTTVDKIDIRCARASEPIPWGFRKNRYFACILVRQ